MKAFFIKSIILVLLVAITIRVITIVISPLIRIPNEYLAATIDKENRLQKIRSPKIILVGGSNLTFGVDSKLIEATFHREVVNMSIHAGLGLEFPLNESLAGVRDSDVVLLSTEYYLDKPDMKLLASLLDANPDAKKYVSIHPDEILPFYVADIQRCVSGTILKLGTKRDSIYRRDGFTPEGDVISHLDKKNIPVTLSHLEEIDYNADLKLINNYIDSVKNRKAKVYYLFPAYQSSSFVSNKVTIDKFAVTMNKNLKCSILNSPNTFVYNDSLFFNTEYHLNRYGRELRTQKLIEILRSIIPVKNQ